MKLSDYVFKYLKEEVADTAFILSGGHAMHLVDSLGASGLKSVCCHHEQAVVGAADGYARVSGRVGVACVTLPGVPNAVTGLTGAWLDSVPLIVISGQVKKEHRATLDNEGKRNVRQLGLSETDTLSLVKPVTKYAVSVDSPEDIMYHLKKAIYLASHGRPGPVWIEIPLDVQAAEIDENNLNSFDPLEVLSPAPLREESVSQVVDLLNNAKRPLLIAGAGIDRAGGREELDKFLKKTNINTVTPIFTADDIVTHDYPNYLGRQGMPGNKSANYAVDNADVILIIGERMQMTQVSFDYDKFAPQAKIIMVDIDGGELGKKTIKPNLAVNADAKEFLFALNNQDTKLNNWEVKREKIDPENYKPKDDYVNVYDFLQYISDYKEKFDVATANGMASVASHQALHIGQGKHFITNAGLGHMGSGIPMALGAAFANNKKPVLCMTGDGSIMFNIQELQTIKQHNLPIKIFIWNNNGYYSIRQTHQNFFKRLFASDPSSGVTLPDFSKLIPGWGLPYEKISSREELTKLDSILSGDGPVVCELMIDPDQNMLPKWMAGMYAENKK